MMVVLNCIKKVPNIIKWFLQLNKYLLIIGKIFIIIQSLLNFGGFMINNKKTCSLSRKELEEKFLCYIVKNVA